MNWYIFRAPYTPGAVPLEQLTFEPPQYLIELRAMKYGSIEIMNEERWAEVQKEHERKIHG